MLLQVGSSKEILIHEEKHIGRIKKKNCPRSHTKWHEEEAKILCSFVRFVDHYFLGFALQDSTHQEKAVANYRATSSNL
jgi:hypothetical protein